MSDSSSALLRVLIVEDDPVTAHDVNSALQRPGFEIVGVARTREEVEKQVLENRPDLALLDVRLEELDDGISIAEWMLRQHGISPVFVTGYSPEAVFSRLDRQDAVGYLRKPFSDPELISCVEEAAERTRSRRQLMRQLPAVAAFADPMENPVFVSDRDGRLRFGNRAAVDQLGWDPEHLMGQLREETLVSARQTDPERSDDGPDHSPIVVRLRPDRSWEGVERVTSIQSPDGELLGTIHHLSPARSSGESHDPPPTADRTSDSPASPPAGGPTPAIRSSALRKLEAISKDPAFRELIRPPRTSPDATSGETASDATSSEASAESQPSAPGETGTDASRPESPTPDFLDQMDDPVVTWNPDGTLGLVNDSARSAFGGSPARPVTRIDSAFEEEDRDDLESGLRRPLADGRKHVFEFHDSRRDLRYEVRAYRSEHGVVALFSDGGGSTTESADSIRQQRLEGLGLLARGFAHDFNNHLTTIAGNIGLARERHPEDEDLHQMLSEAQSAATRATGLVQQLMTFARGGRPIRKRTRIADLVRRILTEQRLAHPEIRFQFQGAEVDLVANVDPAQIGRLIENLVSNSTVAMAEGGILIVRCRRISPETVSEIRERHNSADEDHLLVEVIDTGHGMDEESLGQVFEPYFTTRKEDNASGIGLTVCESIARAHGGFVQLQSKEGKGTIATFCAPLGLRPGIDSSDASLVAEGEAGEIPRLEEPGFQLDRGDTVLVGTRILILEDDAPIRRLMAATLRRAGHEVVETKDGRETVAVYREAMDKGAKFHLLICDLTIENGMGGVETMRQLTRIDPSILAIVSSGYSDAPAMSSPASFGFRGVLPKPYAPSELRAAVHRILSTYHIIS